MARPEVARVRASLAPIRGTSTYPEGERYCGVPVWRGYQFETLAERRVV